ncbi:unnamed protein product [Parnassius apollo]|uniref:(apollo) hypothetical protein n=1 Tax=Parnassius apollo TaxID=110799 RepID=A0A8S3X0J5_PARAO|nr:unnamed protein product [Parnassius apollo]
MNKLEVDAYFELLESILTVDDGVLKPSCIFNMDETGLQLNNRPGHVLAEKGSKAVSTVTSTEKGETITVIACCNAEASADNAIAGFKATGVHPFNPTAIPDYAFTQELTKQMSKSQNECTATVMVEEQEENTSNIASANLESVPNTFEVR